MRLEKLFKVLVVGGTVLTAAGLAGCTESMRQPVVSNEDGASADGEARGDDGVASDGATVRDGARESGVSSWMSWFTPPEEEDAGTDAAVGDSAAASGEDASANDGVSSWLTWV